MRDNYRKALIVRNRNSGRAKDRAVKYEKQLSFLDEKFSFTTRKRNIIVVDTAPSESPDSEEPQVKVRAVESSSQTSEPHHIHQKSVESKHELNAFFEGIAETVKTFPKKFQIQLKREVFNLVNDTETSLLENQNAVYYSMDSPMVGLDFMRNKVTESPSGTSGSNEYTTSPNPLQATDTALDLYCDIDIKTEAI